MIINEDDYLAHYGTPRHSGRYPWGSSGWGDGEEDAGTLPRTPAFHDIVNDMKRQGLSVSEICEGLDIGTRDKEGKFHPSSGQLRARVTISRNQRRQANIAMAQRLRDKGLSLQAIAERMNLPGDSSVRALLAPGVKDRSDILMNTANMLKERVDSTKELRPLDIGSGQEHYLNISAQKLNAAVAVLEAQGYKTHTLKVPQLGTQFDTKTKTLCPPGTTWGEAQKAVDKIMQIQSFSDDGGRTYGHIHKPLPIDPKRVAVKYKGEGGDEADGVIYVRPGVPDLSIGKKRYAQVRIQVGDGHFLKGMAIYKDDLPPGVDILFNTNKENTGNKLDAMKPLKTENPDYPFGSVVRQILDNPGTPDERVSSVMNIMGSKEGSGEEGSWGTWKKSLSTQFLSKQSPTLVKSQLEKTYSRRKKTFEEIESLTNPAVKKILLKSFSDETDKAAVRLDAARFRKQGWNVLMPINTLPPYSSVCSKLRGWRTSSSHSLPSWWYI